jgi:hypothetical protein
MVANAAQGVLSLALGLSHTKSTLEVPAVLIQPWRALRFSLAGRPGCFCFLLGWTTNGFAPFATVTSSLKRFVNAHVGCRLSRAYCLYGLFFRAPIDCAASTLLCEIVLVHLFPCCELLTARKSAQLTDSQLRENQQNAPCPFWLGPN